MGSLNVLHHAQCFDGAASAALAKAFFDLHLGPQADVRFIAKDHCRGDPYTDADFDADCTVSVDFRYTQRPGLTWFFDHHASAFQQPGDREHFVADRSGRKFHDPKAASCAAAAAMPSTWPTFWRPFASARPRAPRLRWRTGAARWCIWEKRRSGRTGV